FRPIRPMQRERFRDARTRREAAYVDRLVDGLLGHPTVCRPFASGDRNESGARHVQDVLARDGGRLALGVAADEGAQPCEYAQDVVVPDGSVEVVGGMLE